MILAATVFALLQNVDEIGVTQFNSKDVVRHPVVAHIVDAYAAYEEKHNKSSTYMAKNK